MFGSVLSYITLRLLGEEVDSGAEAMAIVKGRKWILLPWWCSRDSFVGKVLAHGPYILIN